MQANTSNLIEDPTEIRQIARTAKRVAVIGIKTEAQSNAPGYYVPQSLVQTGIEIVPVPVYYPDATHILGQPVRRTVSEIEGPLDIVVMFRRSEDIPAHLADLLEKKPSVVWFQSGIRNDEAARALADSGIRVVQDRCLMVERRVALAQGS